MMSDPTTVDQVTVDEVTGKLVLLIEEDRPWTEADLMHRQLVAKIKLYVRTIRSPAFVQEHKRQPKDTIVRLVSDHRPGEGTRQLLKRVGYELQKHGIDFEQEVASGDSTYPPSRSAPSTGTTAPPTTAPPTAAPPPPPPPPPPQPKPAAPAPPPPVAEPPPAAPPPRPPEPVAPPPQRDTPEPQELEPIASADLPEEDVGGLPFVDPETPPQKAAAGVGAASGSTELDDDETVFPEEEFGRTVDWELGDGPLVFESGSGKKMVLNQPGGAGSTAPPITYEEAAALERPGIFRALWAALTAAVTGALFWPLVAAAVGQTVGPVAIAIGFMVGFAVRLKASPSIVYRIIAVIGTFLGFAIGASLTAATLAALNEGSGFGGIIAILSSASAILPTVLATYRWYDLVFFGIGLYLAIRLAAPKAES